jgi:hypothetical protein
MFSSFPVLEIGMFKREPPVDLVKHLHAREHGRVDLVRFRGSPAIVRVYDAAKMRDSLLGIRSVDNLATRLAPFIRYWRRQPLSEGRGRQPDVQHATPRATTESALCRHVYEEARSLFGITGSVPEGLGLACGPGIDPNDGEDRRQALLAVYRHETCIHVLLSYDERLHGGYSHYDGLLGYRVRSPDGQTGNIEADFEFRSLALGEGSV